MKQSTHEVREKKNPNIIPVKFDIVVPSLGYL